jgi:hypothetical protein
VPLSEDEQRILQQIEQQFHVTDPEFAGEIEKHSLYSHYARLLKWAGALFFVCTLVLVVALATETTFIVAFVAFVGMLACALWFERSVRKLGKAGLEQLTQSFHAGGLKDSFGSAGQKMRDRFHRDEDPPQ